METYFLVISYNGHVSSVSRWFSGVCLEILHHVYEFYVFKLLFIWITILYAGIGLNIDNEKPTICLNAALQKLTPFACKLQREEVMAAFFNKFESLYEVFMQQGE